MTPRPRLCLNRLPSALPSAVEAFNAQGFETIPVSFVAVEALPVDLDPGIVELDRYDAVVITSPEAAHRFVAAVERRWPQWPVGLTLWCVGEATAAQVPPEAPPVRVADAPGSASLMAQMEADGAFHRCLIATGAGSGRQFEALTDTVGCALDFLDLYRVVPKPPELSDAAVTAPYWVHGSAYLLEVAQLWAETHAPWWSQRVHFVTSDRAEMLLPTGSRYYRILTPAPDAVQNALRGEPCVKDEA